MIFPEFFIDDLKRRISLSKVVSKRVKLKRNGNIHKGLCPFHQEKTPSFTVQDHKGTYYCFGCQASGDVISFINETEKSSFEDTVKYLANLAGISIPKQDPIEQKKIEHKHSLVEVLLKVTKWFQKQLKLSINHEAYEYFQSRGIEEQDIKTFSLGYAPNKGLLAFLQKNDISFDLAVEVGLVIKNDFGYAERFRDRIIFPIKNQKNQVVGFGARALSSDVMPKYLNSPETSLFKKNNLLYAADIATKSSLKNERIIVVEGYMDAIFMHKAGLNETVATLGTAFNQTHLSLLWNIVNEPILCFDGDEAGKRAMLKAAYIALPLLSPGSTLKFCFLPKGLDPDDVIKQHGVSYINRLVDKSLNLSDFIWQEELKNSKLNTPEGKALFEQKIYDLIKQIENPIVRGYYQQFMKDKLWQAFKGFKLGKKHATLTMKENSLVALAELSIVARLEYSLFAKLLNYQDLLNDKEIFDDINNLELED